MLDWAIGSVPLSLTVAALGGLLTYGSLHVLRAAPDVRRKRRREAHDLPS